MIWKILLWVAVALGGLWLFFAFLPSLVSFFFSFGRTDNKRDVSTAFYPGSYYNPFEERIRGSMDFLASLGHEDVSIEVPGRGKKPLTLRGKLYAGGRKKLALVMHGYKVDPDFAMCIWEKLLYDNGFSLLVPDQRAHFSSDGRFITMGLSEARDVSAWAEYAVSRYPDSELLVLGMSMGGASVLFAGNYPKSVRAIIADCPFVSPSHQLERVSRMYHIPLFIAGPPTRMISRMLTGEDFRRNCTENARNMGLPLLIIAGNADTTVDCRSTDAIIENNPSASRILVEGAEHAVALPCGGDGAERQIIEFLNKYFEE